MRKTPSLESQSSFERLQQLVKKEGKSARNLVAWSVPPAHAEQAPGRARGRGRGKTAARRGNAGGSVSSQLSRSERMCVAAAGHYSHSALGGKDDGRPPSKSDVHARYWSYLFENLFRAVDEIYRTCEMDGSVIECQEVMMTLNACHRDFSALIDRIEMERKLESCPQSRPAGVAWEVRKTSSPLKPTLNRPHPPRRSAVRSLDMGKTGLTWADRVRGVSAHCTDTTADNTVDTTVPSEDMPPSVTTVPSEDMPPSVTTVPSEDMPTSVTTLSAKRTVPSSKSTTPSADSTTPTADRTTPSTDSTTPSTDNTTPSANSTNQQSSGVTVAAIERTSQDRLMIGENSEIRDHGDCGEGREHGDCSDSREHGDCGEGREHDDCGDSREHGDCGDSREECGLCEDDENWHQLLKEYDESAGQRHVSWAERCESPIEEEALHPMILADTPRSPGRAVTLHKRLSSPSRKRPIEESKRKLDEKQVKAQLARDRLVQEQRLRSQAEQEKVREAKETRESRMRAWREGMEERLLKAEKLRESHLQQKRRKAQDEDAKVSEIAFINTLEAQNRKIQVLRRHQDHEARLADMAEERARRREETIAREEAAQERRRALEEERRAKLRDLDERRRDQVAKIEQLKQERERAREEAALERARERERRLEARNTALQLSTVELEKKIQSKQDESSRRHDQQLEQIKEKAAGSRHTSCEEAPCVVPYSHCKWCSVCNVPIISDVYLQSHERGRRHQEAVSRLPDSHAPIIITLDKGNGEGGSESKATSEHVRASRKRARKLRQRMAARWREQETQWRDMHTAQSDHKSRLQRCVRDVVRLSELCSNRRGLEKTQLQQVDRALSEMTRILTGRVSSDQLCFHQLGGVTMVTDLLANKKLLPEKSLLHTVAVLQTACAGHSRICGYIVASTVFSVLVDVLGPLLSQQPEGVELCAALLRLLGSILSTLSLSSSPPPSLSPAISDCISYIVSVGVVVAISDQFSAVSGPISHPSQLVISAANLLVAVSAALHSRVEDVFSEKRDDPTSLTAVLRDTELVGLLRLLYAILLQDGPPRHSSSPPPLPPHTLSISTACLKAINNFAILDLHMVQTCLGAEGISLEFRHVASYLMWHCTYHHHSDLLQEVILAVGYFSVLQPDNQVLLQSGRSPTLLQLLCYLPFEYFSNPRLSGLLFPTLLSACYLSPENRAILSQEISCQLLVVFLTSQLTLKDKPAGQMNGSQQMCHGCQQSIDDDFRLYIAPDLNWHIACLLCSECHTPLSERETCVIHDGRPYCRTDYIRLFGCVCALCHNNIGASDLIMRAKSQVFHLDCFHCSCCEHRLQPGEQYALSSGKLFCKNHFDALPLDQSATCTPLESSNNSNSNPSCCLSSDPTTSNQRKRTAVPDKGPRVRTVLSEQQLQTLRTVYAGNPRPDALLKEHLVELTGLNPRVIRVWFQNKRCKDKKRAIQAEAIARQQQQQPKQSLPQGKVQIPPLTPQAPPTPDSMGQISPQSAAAMVAFQYPPASYEGPTARPAVSPIVSYHQSMSAWGSPPDNMSTFDAEFSSPMTTEPHNTIYTSVTSQPNAFTF